MPFFVSDFRFRLEQQVRIVGHSLGYEMELNDNNNQTIKVCYK